MCGANGGEERHPTYTIFPDAVLLWAHSACVRGHGGIHSKTVMTPQRAQNIPTVEPIICGQLNFAAIPHGTLISSTSDGPLASGCSRAHHAFFSWFVCCTVFFILTLRNVSQSLCAPSPSLLTLVLNDLTDSNFPDSFTGFTRC